MSFNLKMLNLWIGLCRGVAGLPTGLRNLGYQDKWIEWTLTFFNGVLSRVCPDLIIASRETNHTVLLEFKSGANTEPDQLERYSRVTAKDLVEKAFLEPEATRNHDVALVGRSQHGDRLRIGIERPGYSFPLLLADEDGLALFHNKFQVPELTHLFSPRLKIDWRRVPLGFIPLDSESALWEVAEVVIPKVLHYMSQRRPRVGLDEICKDVCITWGIMGKPAKDALRTRVQDVLREVGRQDFKPYLRWIARIRSLEIVDNPLELEPDRRAAAFRKLRGAQRKFIESLRPKRAAGEAEQQLFPFAR